MNDIPPVSQALFDLSIPHEIFRHPGPIGSLAQAAMERGQEPDQVVRSLLFRVASDSYVMVLVAGEGQVSWPALRSYLGHSRLTTASREEVRRVTGYELGAVAPIGMPVPLRILVDSGVLEQSEISLGSGVRGTAVILRVADLMRALGEVEVASLVSP